AGNLDVASARLDELFASWRSSLRTATFNAPDAAFPAVLVGRSEDFLAVATQAHETPWLLGAIAFARGDYGRAAEIFDEIGTVPFAAYARLHDTRTRDQALPFSRSV